MIGNIGKMNKRLLTLIIVVVVIALLCGVLLLLLNMEPEAAGESSSAVTPATQYLITDKKAADVKTVDVVNETGSFTVARTGEDFTIASYLAPGASGVVPLSGDIKYTATALESFVNEFFTATVSTKIEGAENNLAVYGLDKPRAALTVHYADGASFALMLGNEAPDGASNYLYNPQTKEVWLSSKSNLTRALNSKEWYADKQLMPVKEEETQTFEKLVLGGSYRPAEIVLEAVKQDTSEASTAVPMSSGFKMTAPKERDTAITRVTEMAEGLWGMTAASAVVLDPTPDDLADTGLDVPYSTMASTIDGQEVVIKLGGKTADGQYYCQTSLNKPIYTVSAEVVPWVEYTAFMLHDKFAKLPNINTVSAMTVEYDGAVHRFTVGHAEENTVLASYGGKDIEESVFKAFYQLIISASGEYELPETLPEGTAALMRFTYEYVEAGKTPDVVEFKPLSDRQCIIYVNGEPQFIIRTKYLDKVKSSVVQVLAGEKVVVDW